MLRRLQLFVEITLAARGRFFPLVDGVAPAAARLQRGPPMRDTCREARELLDRPLHGEADRANRLVGGFDGVYGAVRGRVELVELRIHPVYRPSDLVDHRKNFT